MALSNRFKGFTWVAALEYRPGEDHTIDPPAMYDFWRTYRAPFWPADQLSWTYPHPRTLRPVRAVLDVDDPADPGRKVLDNTCIYLCSEIGEGAWHPTNSVYINPGAGSNFPTSYLPLVTIGKCGGALKTQQVLNYSKAKETDRPAGDIYLALCRAMGVTVSSFGSATQVVQELLEVGA